MALQDRSPSKHNRLLGMKVPHPPSTNFHDDEYPSPPAKRLKRLDNTSSPSPSKQSPRKQVSVRHRHEIPDSEDEDDTERDRSDLLQGNTTTQLETALPAVQTDEEAIEAYEFYKAGESEDTLQERLDKGEWVRGRSSIYVDAFRLALDTVLDEEGNLFNEAEHSLFTQWKQLSYEAQYLYVRLFLRKTSAWHRIAKLGYYSDISNMPAAVQELQLERELPKLESEEVEHPGELEPPEGTTLPEGIFTFAECSSAHITTLNEASSLLLLEELKAIAKDAKVNGKNKRELLQNLRRTSGRQGGLAFKRSDTNESTGSAGSETVPMYDEDETTGGTTTPLLRMNRDAHFTRKILEQTGRCIRLSLAPLKLFERVHLVFYRSTEWTEKSLTTLILAKISRRNFPEYIVSRSATIFESRSLLLEFEASLRTQFRVDNILEFNGTPGRRSFEEVKTIFEAVYPRWKVLLAEEQRKEDRVYESGEGAYLRRFNPAWVYTRIVHKGLQPLARFKEHLYEHKVLVELLSQHLFHAARRGAWYQRKALLEEHYMYGLLPSGGRSEEVNKKHWKRIALQTCEEGLQDPNCHIIYHYDLQKRIRKIERQLKIPKREQHEFAHVSLSKAHERSVEGIQIIREPTPSRKPSLTRHSSSEPPPALPTEPTRSGISTKTIWLDTHDPSADPSSQVSVEAMCLSYYRHRLGYKGYHCEGGILRTLFGLLFYDILFAYVPNVFQTPYQTCPLDLHTDTFYSTRISEINARINQICNGDAERLLRETWDAHAERKTCVVGVRWDGYEIEDLCEIARCFQGEALGVTMRVMAQEYAARGGGVPDLFLWKPPIVEGALTVDGTLTMEGAPTIEGPITAERGGGQSAKGGRGEVMFAEVKSENDRLSDTQRLWISVLLNAGVKVELCHAVAKEVMEI